MAVTALSRGVTMTGSSRTCSGRATGPVGLPTPAATERSTFGLLDARATLPLLCRTPSAIHFESSARSFAGNGEPSGGMNGSSFCVLQVQSRLPAGLPGSTTAPPPPPATKAP